MRTPLLAALVFLSPPATAHGGGDCEVAAAAARLARDEGLETAPFLQLQERLCAPRPRVQTRYQVPATETFIHDVPTGTVELSARGSRITDIMNVPATVRVLDLSGTKVSTIRNLPSGLEVLDLSNTEVTDIMNLPAGLKVLNLSGTRVSSPMNLPSGLLALDLGNTPVTTIMNVPRDTCLVTALPAGGHWVEEDLRDCPDMRRWLPERWYRR